MAAVCGLSRDEIQRRLRASGLLYAFESGQIPARDFARQVCDLLGAAISYEDFREIWYSVIDHGAIIPEDLIVSLHQRYPLVLLSNTNELHFEMLRQRCPMLDHFDGYTLSYQLASKSPMKPFIGMRWPKPAVNRASASTPTISRLLWTRRYASESRPRCSAGWSN